MTCNKTYALPKKDKRLPKGYEQWRNLKGGEDIHI